MAWQLPTACASKQLASLFFSNSMKRLFVRMMSLRWLRPLAVTVNAHGDHKLDVLRMF